MTAASGERHYQAKRSGLTWKDVDAMRMAHAAGMRQCEINRQYPRVSHVAIHKIITGKAWNKR